MGRDLMYPPEMSKRILRSSCLSGAAAVVAGYFGIWDCAAVATVVLLTSLNHWREPVVGIRRNVDLLTVYVSAAFHIGKAFDCSQPFLLACCVLSVTGVLCYMGAIYNGLNKYHDEASWCHCGLHTFGAAACIALYCGIEAT